MRYGATIDPLCNEWFAGELMALCEGNSALYWAAIRPEDTTPMGAVAVGHFVQVLFWELSATGLCRRPVEVIVCADKLSEPLREFRT